MAASKLPFLHLNTMKLNKYSLIKKSLCITYVFFGLNSIAVGQVQKLPTAHAKINNKSLFIEIAATEQNRNYGLMHRNHLEANSGMLFVFEQAAQPCFWMKNTLIPLSIAFIDDKGYITDIKDMQPNTTISHCPSRPVKYALETNQGWYVENNIKVGEKVCIENKYPANKLGMSQSLLKDLGINIYCKQ